MADLRCSDHYHANFDPKIYLELFYKNFKGEENEEGSVVPLVNAFHDFWSSYVPPTDTEVRYLEYGGGPSIMSLVFACPKVDHIVFAEYTEANRQAVKSWAEGKPDAHDWTSLIEVVVLELEQERGIVTTTDGSNEIVLTDKDKRERVVNRVDELRGKIKSIVPCDVTKEPIVQLDASDVAKPFDVVTTSLCLEACVWSVMDYTKAVLELSKLLKPNGHLFMYGVLEQSFYCVSKEKFKTFPLTEENVKEALNEAGIETMKFVTIPVNYLEIADCKSLFYTYGRKSGGKR